MKRAVVKIKGIAPYSQRRYIPDERKPKESYDDYERRIWRKGMSCDEKDVWFIPPMCFKNSLACAAQFLRIRIPGRDRSEYTKHFRAGVLVTDGLSLKVKREKAKAIWLHVPSNGRTGGTTRVEKCFPICDKWGGTVTYHILDETITKDIFLRVLKESGNIIGLGFFRPERGGYYGRFVVESLKWIDVD